LRIPSDHPAKREGQLFRRRAVAIDEVLKRGRHIFLADEAL
jgi:hypothetical protein